MSMAGARSAARQALAALSDCAVHEGPPDVLSPPAVVLRPGDPWLAADGTVTLQVDCIVRTIGPNLSVLARLEDLVEAARAALEAGGIAAGEVRPGTEDIDGQTVSANFEIAHRTC
jgi:hypothetical protein